MVTEKFILEQYPLHYAVWKNDEVEVENLLQDIEFRKDHLEKLDPRGRTPLIVAILFGNLSMVDRLLNKYNADSTFTQESGWNVIHEAVSVKNKDILKMVLARRDIQKCEQQDKLVPDLLHELKNAPDFYVEMKWEFSTWLPFVSRMLPPGQWHRVYKLGANLRVDSSSSDSGWDEGVSLVFKEEGKDIFILEIDHATKQVLKQIICSNDSVLNGGGGVSNGRNYGPAIALKLANPSVASIMDWKTVSFQRKESYLGEGTVEEVNGFKCKVFQSSGFGLQTKFRTEHLSDTEKSKVTLEQKPGLLKKVMSYLTKYEFENQKSDAEGTSKGKKTNSSLEITPEEYFDKDYDLGGKDIGPSKEVKSKRVKLDATLWICDDYPLNIKEQLIPIVNLMALTNSRFRSLKDFIELQMPSGFPVKLEVPVYHFVNGLITFHNIFGTQCKIDGVSTLEDNGRLTCVLDEKLFEPPAYEIKTAICFGPNLSREDDDFFGLFRDGDSNEPQVDIYEALNAPRSLLRDNTPDDDAEEQLLQRAIEESLVMEKLKSNPEWRPSGDVATFTGGASAFPTETHDLPRSASLEELEKALALSRAETEQAERTQKEEDEMLQKVLEMSLQEF